ncbi:DnaJ-domain-containing protein [Trichoderma citrinoviride]|uniref:DnaJ-domain-containing protein n=1 Tax=Trichoderma citrinoviride TaxID=58853 RepID=A0A2T4B9S4_9HYPO|nr:DnaJ-domain-containing protein [Trichoderma citrinoviride]PTB66080.1 DnaJ-domain-containing protein [Trichoderma citrinoviride]
MGAEQSSNAGSRRTDTETTQRTCYYELLEVERTATDIEIKKAYRKKALELHPDRNFNNVEAATKKFAEVQAAYDILSDPQERAWYDSHRDSILSGQDDSQDASAPPTFHNVRLTTADDIMRLISRFNVTVVPYTDDANGFFTITRETFEHLAEEEEAAADYDGTECPEYPTFGSADDEFDSTVKPFYNAWTGFSTKKSFMWQDKFRLSDAPDRRTRRWMEKENKKIRDDAIKEFNDAVRFLVSFVKKRDPRYVPNNQSEADRHKSLRTAAVAQAARSRAANKDVHSSFEVPDWVLPKEDGKEEDQPSESEESETEILECVVCNKRFKSEKQFESHERSKKHIKAVQDLRRQLKKETANLDLEATTSDAEASRDAEATNVGPEISPSLPEEKPDELGQANTQGQEAVTEDEASAPKGVSEAGEEASHDDKLDESFDKLNLRSTSEGDSIRVDLDEETQGDSPEQPQEEPSVDDTKPKVKIGKAKLKRQKKAAAMTAENEVGFVFS